MTLADGKRTLIRTEMFCVFTKLKVKVKVAATLNANTYIKYFDPSRHSHPKSIHF